MLTKLPVSILLKIFQYLEVDQLVDISEVSKSLKTIVEHDDATIWRVSTLSIQKLVNLKGEHF